MTRIAAGLALVAAIAVVAFSEVGTGDASAQAAARRAAATSVAAGSSRFTMSWIAPEVPDEVAPEMKVEGVMDYVRHRGEINYWHEHRVIYDGDAVYMRWPLPWRDNAPWVRFERDGVDEDPFNLEVRAMHNPLGLLEFLTGASRDTRIAGAEPVRGRPTTHYEGTLDLQLVVDRAPVDKREELQSWLAFIAEHEPTKVPFGLWVDDRGLTRRLRIDGPGASVTIEYFDYGVPVEISTPGQSEIISQEQFSQELEAHTEDETCDDDPSGDDPSSIDDDSDTDGQPWHFGGTGGELSTSDSSTTPRVQLCVYPSDSD